MHRALFEAGGPRERQVLVDIAEELGLDLERFAADLDDPLTARAVARHRQVCSVAGARATPTLFINGELVRGERGVDGLSRVIDDVLSDAVD